MITNDEYTTLKKSAEYECNIQRSRFITYATPVDSAEEALMWIDEIRKEHYAATHVCWAYAIAPALHETRSNDDGEPSGTAGKPILGRLVSAEITGTAIAVVRYFGGVKLGTSGLIEAYRGGAEEVLRIAEKKQVVLTEQIEVLFAPNLTGEVMQRIKRNEANIVREDYTTQSHLFVELRRSKIDTLIKDLTAVYGVTIADRQEKDEA